MKIETGNDMFFGASPEIFRRAEELRKRMTPAEELLWEELKGKKVNGMKFRRQHPLNNFIADFYCHQKRLVIELDGSIHDEADQAEYDLGRTEELSEFEIKVIRFSNEMVMRNLKDVIEEIKKVLSG
ncbi:MAG TPA: endonuclease domain-containing protein [Chitinophagales bacterium]|nr:endonuclease domain-containing protein [Chitinophagales bacterium]